MIYLILNESNTICKIGISNNPQNRLKQLQTGSLEKLRLDSIIEGSYKEERLLHKKFKDIRENGEWFYYVQEIKEEFGSDTPTDLIIWNHENMMKK